MFSFLLLCVYGDAFIPASTTPLMFYKGNIELLMIGYLSIKRVDRLVSFQSKYTFVMWLHPYADYESPRELTDILQVSMLLIRKHEYVITHADVPMRILRRCQFQCRATGWSQCYVDHYAGL